jgi:recombination protein RecT
MANEIVNVSMSSFIQQPNVNKYIESLLGDRKAQFTVALVSLANSSEQLKNCDKNSILACALTATGLNLSLSPQLGFCHVVPYGNKAQFMISAKGLAQLSLRTGIYEYVSATEVYENQFKSYNSFTGELNCDFDIEGSGKIVGYAAGFKTKDGYNKTIYWSRDKMLAHAKKYSKSYNRGPWVDNEISMGCKTMLKQLLSKWALLSDVYIETALAKDQAVLTVDVDTGKESLSYADNPRATKDATVYAPKELVFELIKVYGKEKVEQALKDNEFTDVLHVPMDSFNVFAALVKSETSIEDAEQELPFPLN